MSKSNNITEEKTAYSDYYKQYYANNKDKYRKAYKKYYSDEEKRARIREQQKHYYQVNKEKIKLHNKERRNTMRADEAKKVIGYKKEYTEEETKIILDFMRENMTPIKSYNEKVHTYSVKWFLEHSKELAKRIGRCDGWNIHFQTPEVHDLMMELGYRSNNKPVELSVFGKEYCVDNSYNVSSRSEIGKFVRNL